MRFNYCKLFLLLFSIMLLVGCSNNELTREKAATLIKEHHKYPNIELRMFGMDPILSNKGFYDLYKQGLLAQQRGFMAFQSTLTKKGQVYFVNSKALQKEGMKPVITNAREFKSITGIFYENEEKTKAKVNFVVVRRSPTPFGDWFEVYDGEEQNYSVIMAYYDDGWRVESSNELDISIKEYSGLFKEYIKEISKIEDLKDITVKTIKARQHFMR